MAVPYADRVARGVARMAAVESGWRSRIDRGTLDVSNGQCCVATQVFDGFLNAMTAMRLTPDDIADHGFGIAWEEWRGDQSRRRKAYAELDRLWREAINERIES